MQRKLSWANLGILSFEEQFGFSVETLSIDEQSCNLSGAWSFDDLEDTSLKNILLNRLLIVLGISDKESIANKFESQTVEISTFISDAAQEADSGVILFNDYLEKNAKKYTQYMGVSPTERKLLPKVVKKKLEPIYAHSWNLIFDEFAPEQSLRQLGKRDYIEGTPGDMKRLIATSWLVKHLVNRWRDDENERKSRDYLYPDGASAELLPKSWMVKLQKLNSSK